MNTPPLEILVAEDSPTQAEKLKYILEENDFRVVIASDGKKALETMRAHKPILLITDVNMPEMSGYELCRQVRDDEKLGDLPVILLTSLSDPEDVFKGLECGADNFITKPYEEVNLLARIQYLLANVHLRKREKVQISMEVFLAGRKHVITSDRAQILNLLLSTYEAAVHKNRELAGARDDLAKLNAQLEDKVMERTASLEAEITERKRAQEEIRKLNEELELRVVKRTEQLLVANRELEAFSYSVSHDLRTPLRSIDGFSRILLEDYADKLDDEGRDCLETVRAATQKMGHLIDDMLQLSRITRSEIHVRPVNLSLQVADLAKDLRKTNPGRTVEVVIEPDLIALADPRLIEIALGNLLGNAWKFTSQQPAARIEFGRKMDHGLPTYFLRDNGAGFDMAYAEKLFGAFQRLHTVDEFPGTGVGLATVQRVIHRHGGKVWAEAKVGEGATFYFSLPTETEPP